MAADWGILLVDAVLREKTMGPLREQGLGAEMLSSPASLALEAIIEFANKPETRGVVPPRKLVEHRIPIIEWPVHTEEPPSLEILCQICMDQYLQREIEVLQAELVDLADENPKHALTIGRQRIQELGAKIASGNKDIDLSAALGDMVDDHFETVDTCGGVTGLLYPWDPLNEELMGMQKGELILFYGVPKSMKCVAEGQCIEQPDGTSVAIEDLPTHCQVPSYTKATGKLRWAAAERVNSGTKPCLRVRTTSGFELTAGDEHYYMVPEGPFQKQFKRARDLKEGNWVAVTRTTPKHVSRTQTSGTKPLPDGVPRNPNLERLIDTERGDKPWPEHGGQSLTKARLFQQGGASRNALRKLADEWKSEKLRVLADQEIIWEQIQSIEDVGSKPCYDICIRDGQDPNFAVEGFVVHNTWLALYVTLFAYVHSQARVLVIAPEMSSKLPLRIASILSEESYRDIKRGFPGYQEDQELAKRRAFVRHVAKSLRETEEEQQKLGQRLILTQAGLGLNNDPVGQIEAKIDAYEPALIFIDSAYMLNEDRDWKAISRFLQDLKLLAEDRGVTIILTSQENTQRAVKAAHAGKNPGSSTASFAQAFIEFCDLAVRVIHMKKGPDNTLLSLHLSASRETALAGLTVHGNPGGDFSFHSLDLISMEDALEADTEKPAPKKKKKKPASGVSLADKYAQWEDTE